MSKSRPSPIWLVVALALAACDDDDAPSRPSDDDPLPPSGACQQGPGELPRPPAGSLPCELLPPGLTLAAKK